MPNQKFRLKEFSIRQVITICLVFFCVQTGNAQLNESDTAAFQIRATLSGFRQQGNVELGIIRTRLEAVGELSPQITIKTQNNTLYQEFGGRKADNDLFSRNFLYFRPKARWYPFAMAFVQSNFRQKIDLRYFTGVGLTWQALRAEKHILKFSAACVYEQSRFSVQTFNKEAYNGNSKIELWRPTAYVSGNHKIADSPLRLYYGGYAQGGIADASNYRIWIESGLEVSIWKALNLSAQYTWIFDEVVASRVKQKDAIFSLGVSYSYKKAQKHPL